MIHPILLRTATVTFVGLLPFLSCSAAFHQGDLDSLVKNRACRGGHLEGSDLSHRDHSADVRGSCLVGADLRETPFEKDHLYGADIRRATLSDHQKTFLDPWNIPGRAIIVQENGQEQKGQQLINIMERYPNIAACDSIFRRAQQGDAFSQFSAAFMLEIHGTLEDDKIQARTFYEKAAAQDFWPAINNLGWMYEWGYGVEKSLSKAQEYYEKAHLNNMMAAFNKARFMAVYRHDRDSFYSLGAKYKSGRDGVPLDMTLAFHWISQAADLGNIKACRYAGMMCRSGTGTNKDTAKAFHYFKKGSDPQDDESGIQGDIESQYELGRLYETGQGTEQDFFKARLWYEKACVADDTGALMHLGKLHEEGKGGDISHEAALSCYQRVASQGRISGMYHAGRILGDSGGEQEAKKAVDYYQRLLKEPTHIDAQFRLARHYHIGRGVDKDIVLAKKHYTSAAEAGHDLAQISLTLMNYSPQSKDEKPLKTPENVISLDEIPDILHDSYVMPILGNSIPDDSHDSSEAGLFLPKITNDQDFYYVGLSIDGGGIRGRIPAQIMAEIESFSDTTLSSLIDRVGGTSIGGILSMGVTASRDQRTPLYSAQKFVDIFDQNGADIFPTGGFLGTFMNPVTKLISVQYSERPLETLLQGIFEDLSLSEALKPTLVTSTQIPESDSFIFDSLQARHSDDHNYKMWQVARATSAAPTYFKAMTLQNISQTEEKTFVDGGLWHNNPADSVYAGVVKQYKDSAFKATPENTVILSLGTGLGPVSHEIPKSVGQLQAINPLINCMMRATSHGVHEQMTTLLENNYIRLQPNLTSDIPLNDISELALEKLDSAAQTVMGDVETVARFLAENKARRQERL